ncbi:cellulose synthase complex outer membrane protein BcsC [Klebsiella grimontii]|uniref:cellulose synthase complex outer membrane protein BcsC n=1 Tax=Klebsiella grimontii TaxID=2058152 RepID=UPI00254C5063|nr:cellulose synthase complex outer membrane protein BcsC [Klebsiella grimontii]MDK7026117.1 cellulose synthase complex outer membrane protein BcsC [Klebsiella grimontii]
MHKFSLSLFTLSLGVALMPLAHAATTPVQEHLLEQVRLGEASKREDLVRQSLYRLELIDPNNPDVVAARMRYLLRQGDTAGAKQQLERLAKLAPESPELKASRDEMKSSTGDGRQELQQARLLGVAGKVDEAIAAYEKLFNGVPDDDDAAIEYWTLVARLPARHNEGINQLKKLNARLPGNVSLQTALAKQMFGDNKPEEGFAYLEQMSRSAAGRGIAADIWFNEVKSMPVSRASVQALQRFLMQFPTGSTSANARVLLAQQQTQLKDPTFRDRAEGLAAVKAGKGSVAVADLQQAVRADAKDSDAVGALGQAYSQRGDRARAVAQLSKAIKMDPDSPSRDKWDSLLKTNRYWLLIKQGDSALKSGQLAQAQNHYAQAQRIDNTDSYAVLGLGDVAAARKENAAAERYYQRALRMDRGNSLAVRGLANLYRGESPEKASAYIASLSPGQRRSIDDIERSLINDRLEKQAEALESQGNWAQAAEVQRRRLALDPDSVWIAYRLSRDLVSAGSRSEADAIMRAMVNRQPGDADRVYAYGLYLSGNNQDEMALAQINALPRGQWTDNIRELEARLQSDNVLRQANQLRDDGQEDRAIALIQQQPASVRYALTLADWAQQRGDSQTAIAQYQRVLGQQPDNGDARLGLAEVYLADGDKNAARAQVAQLKGEDIDSINMQRRIAQAQAGLGDRAQAQQTFARIVPQAKALPPSMESALVLRDAARFQAQNDEPQQALEGYKDAMVASGVARERPQDNDTFTRLTRNDSSDDWLKRGIRSDAADLYRQQDLNVTLEHDYWGSSGTGGYSDLKAHTTMLHVDAPLADGRMFFRTDLVNMNAGSFSTKSDGSYSPSWGTCGEIACTGGSKHQSDSGASVAVGWKNETWSGDIGTTPMGFNVVDVVGGLSYSSDVGPLGYTVNLHRRPISSSLLAFGGQKDNPNDGHTGKTWGGVRADGGGVSLSYDKGEANGVWSSLGVDQLTGKNVADNWRVRWMTGYYYKVVNEDNRRVTVGLNNMLWHYDKDLSGYTLGQGGYYSPQEYVSFSVPVTWRQRTENWSWELGGSVSWSHSRTKTEARYPLLNLLPSQYRHDASQLTEEGSSSSGVGYTARALIERRVTSNWFVGAAVDIQQAKDYTPSHALLYVRYSASGWQGDMDMPPQPLVPYADW